MASRQAGDGLLKRRQSLASLAFGATRGAFRLEGVELGAIQKLPGMGGFDMSSSFIGLEKSNALRESLAQL
jgi:hypothetical protein